MDSAACNNRFITIPRAALPLPKHLFRLLAAVLSFRKGGSKSIRCSDSEIAEVARMEPGSVAKGLSALEAPGFLYRRLDDQRRRFLLVGFGDDGLPDWSLRPSEETSEGEIPLWDQVPFRAGEREALERLVPLGSQRRILAAVLLHRHAPGKPVWCPEESLVRVARRGTGDCRKAVCDLEKAGVLRRVEIDGGLAFEIPALKSLAERGAPCP